MSLHDPRIDEEIRHHIEERAERLMAEGIAPDEARIRAEAAFGDVAAVRQEVSRIREPTRGPAGRLWDRLREDLRFALRQGGRSPGFTAVAILTLGLGIGASVSIFALVKAVVLDPLPYPEPDRLVLVREISPNGVPFTVSEPNYQDYRDRLRRVELLTATSRADYATEAEGRARRVIAGRVTPSFFPLFGGSPVLGRSLSAAESAADAPAVVVLTHDFWVEHFSGDSSVVGRSLALDDIGHEIVGVMPAGWEPTEDVDVWTPLPLPYANREDHDYTVLGRLAAGASPGAASEEIRMVAEALGGEHPETNRGWSAGIEPLKQALIGPERIQAGRVLLGAVALLLLMACASVANLLLARATGRGREMSLRATLGAGRGRLVQQLLTESLLLAGLGAVVGLALAHLFLPVLQIVSPQDTPRLGEAAIDGSTILAAAAMAAGSSLLFGLAPVLHVLGRSLSARVDARSVVGRVDHLRTGLVVGQVAVSLALLVGAGSLSRSFLTLQSTDSGLPLETTMAVPLMMSGDRYTTEERAVVRAAILERVGGLPGVVAVGSTNVLPFSGMSTMIDINVEGRPTEPDDAPSVRWRAVSPGFFRAAGLTPLAGRAFARGDFGAEAEAVVVLSESMARAVLGSPNDAVGGRIAMGWNGRSYRRVVGVVPDIEDRALTEAAPLTLFLPDPGALAWVNLLIRFGSEGPAPSAVAVREAIQAVDPGLPVPTVELLAERFGETVAGHGFNLMLVAAFATLALSLALLGVYGLVSFAVERRTREIGLRMALGARAESVSALVLGQGMKLAAGGVVGGLVLSLWLGKYLEGLLFGTEAADPAHLVLPVVVLVITTLAATWLPARRATRVEPSVALAAE